MDGYERRMEGAAAGEAESRPVSKSYLVVWGLNNLCSEGQSFRANLAMGNKTL